VKISKIETQKKNKKRSTIYIDGNFAFGLSNEIILKFDIHEGDPIDEGTIQNVLLEQEKQRIRERAHRILRYRKRSVKELEARLVKIGFDTDQVNEVVKEFIANNILNDDDFAESFVADYTNLKPKGDIFINRELKKRGVSQKAIESALRLRDEQQIVSDFLQRKLSHFDMNNPKERQKVLRRLLSRGFTPSVVYSILDRHEK
jgi:regulatory protein